MLTMLEDAEFNGKPVNNLEARPLIVEALLLVAYVHLLAQVSAKI